MENKENGKKQVPLRLSPKLYAAIAAWAEDDFRSVNGQIEYLLTECASGRRTGNTWARRSTSRRSWTSRNKGRGVPGGEEPCGSCAA